MSTLSLFDPDPGNILTLAPGLIALPGLALPYAPVLAEAVKEVVHLTPWRHMQVPSGHRMSAAQSSCGALGWISDEQGYRYSPTDPQSGVAWPALPTAFQDLLALIAHESGQGPFMPDTCLINYYDEQAHMSLHQDRNERDLQHPIVSVSLGREALFLWGGAKRTDPVRTLRLRDGDVLVWWGPSRLNFHGIRRLEGPAHPLWGTGRVNLTFRKAG